MNDSVSQKIKSILNDKNISITKFANAIGMQQVTCNRQLKDEQPVSLKLLEGFLNTYPEVSAEWLLRDKGDKEQYFDNCTKEEIKRFAEMNKENEMLKEMLKEMSKEIKFYRSLLEKLK